jgi:hypothetical protein
VYVPVPIVHAGSKSMLYVCGSAWFTAVDLARDDIVVYVLIYQFYVTMESSDLRVLLTASLCGLRIRIATEALGNSQGITIPFFTKQASAHIYCDRMESVVMMP